MNVNICGFRVRDVAGTRLAAPSNATVGGIRERLYLMVSCCAGPNAKTGQDSRMKLHHSTPLILTPVEGDGNEYVAASNDAP